MIRRSFPFVLLAALGVLAASAPALAHHGIVSLGLAGLEGPGAPVETSSSATLPRGSWFATVKLDYARFETYTRARDGEGDSNAFWIYGVGHGVTPWLSAYLFVPYSTKRTEDNSFTTSGFADLAIMAVLGLKFDRGLQLVPENESLDDLEDWHFTLYGGLTLPTGNENVRDANGEIDPGMSLGFGTPSYSLGGAVTKMMGARATAVLEVSTIVFTEHEYADGARVRFGNEWRANGALAWRLVTARTARARLDANLEGSLLRLGRDEVDGIGEEATGGSVFYALPGLRLYYRSASVGLGVKLPAWNGLHEASDQQAVEGKEDYRVIFTFSALL